jgi:hypothetical protein
MQKCATPLKIGSVTAAGEKTKPASNEAGFLLEPLLRN